MWLVLKKQAMGTTLEGFRGFTSCLSETDYPFQSPAVCLTNSGIKEAKSPDRQSCHWKATLYRLEWGKIVLYLWWTIPVLAIIAENIIGRVFFLTSVWDAVLARMHARSRARPLFVFFLINLKLKQSYNQLIASDLTGTWPCNNSGIYHI